MNDYNDGNWWGWNGGDCPVHEKSTVCGVEESGTKWTALAGENDWQSFRGAFRVVDEHKDPREYWLYRDDVFGILRADTSPRKGAIRVREVTEQ